MILLKCFAINETLIDNNPNIIAPFGELSPFGLTFSKEPRQYLSTVDTTIPIVHFPHKYNQLGYNEQIPQNQIDHLVKISKLVYTRTLTGTTPLTPGDFVNYINVNTTNEVENVTTGGVFHAGGKYIPEWVQWKNKTIGQDNLYKVWFVDQAFVGQFDDYEITVISPIDPPDLFFGVPADVKALLNGLSYFDLMYKIDQARNNCPETYLWGKEFDYVNPTDQNDKTPAKFSVLVYGAAGYNIDYIKEAIVDYLLDNSSHTADQWKNILPELFKRTEFMLFPEWTSIAIENIQDVNNRIYSPVVRINPLRNFMIANAQAGGINYGATHVNNHGQVIPLPYMSIMCGIVGHPENRDGKVRITDWYKDYFFTSTASTDFNKMALSTQNWVIFISELVMRARDVTTISTIPYGFARIIRGNRIYLSRSHDDIQFLVRSPTSI